MGLLIYGAGGSGREVAWLAAEVGRDRGTGATPFGDLLGFIDDGSSKTSVNGHRVFDLATAASKFPDALVFVAIGSGALRERLTARALGEGLRVAPPLIAPSARVSEWNRIGDGSCLCEGCVVTVNVTIGQHVQVNMDCTIGHDAVLEDYVTLAPGVHVSGWVRIGRGAYIGTGANIINGTPEKPLRIGEGAIVGAGACVIEDVSDHATVVGIPAKTRGTSS